jgi:hypothetical protein
MSIQMTIIFDECVDYLVVVDSSSRDEIKCVLGLSEIVTV